MDSTPLDPAGRFERDGFAVLDGLADCATVADLGSVYDDILSGAAPVADRPLFAQILRIEGEDRPGELASGVTTREPALRSLHTDPRFFARLARLGLDGVPLPAA